MIKVNFLILIILTCILAVYFLQKENTPQKISLDEEKAEIKPKKNLPEQGSEVVNEAPTAPIEVLSELVKPQVQEIPDKQNCKGLVGIPTEITLENITSTLVDLTHQRRKMGYATFLSLFAPDRVFKNKTEEFFCHILFQCPHFYYLKAKEDLALDDSEKQIIDEVITKMNIDLLNTLKRFVSDEMSKEKMMFTVNFIYSDYREEIHQTLKLHKKPYISLKFFEAVNSYRDEERKEMEEFRKALLKEKAQKK
jgi:uncharacterized protein YeeX (DUF496 family)